MCVCVINHLTLNPALLPLLSAVSVVQRLGAWEESDSGVGWVASRWGNETAHLPCLSYLSYLQSGFVCLSVFLHLNSNAASADAAFA